MIPKFLRPERLPYVSVEVVRLPATICAWCPDFNPRDERNRGASHGICPACAAKLHAQMDAASVLRQEA